MKAQSKTLLRICCAITALAGAAGIGQAQSPIIYNFASGLQGWAGNEPAGMAATYSWNATNGSTGGGCMEVVYDGVTTTEMDPIVTLPAPINEAEYFSVSIHMKVDPNSGMTGANYGNLQAVFHNASDSWDSIWYGALYPPAANNWTTYSFIISRPYQPAETSLQFQFQGAAGYSGPVTNYIDNITILPIPNPWVVDAFTNDTSSTYAEEGWTGVSATTSLNTSQDGGGGFTPPGALEMDIAYATGGAWQQSWILKQQAFDPSRFAYFECDLKVDAANSTPFSDGSYGALALGVRDGNWNGPYDCSPANTTLDSSYTSWKHIKLALPEGGSLTNSVGFDIEIFGTANGPIRVYLDNIELSSPVNHPVIAGLRPGTPGGVKVSVDADGTSNPFDQEGFSSPVADNNDSDFFWVGQTPATYAFTLTNFPAPAVAPGFDSHVYIVNGDTTAALWAGAWAYNQTYSGVPYNAPDYAGLHVQNGTNGGVVVSFEWKTNAPNVNPPSNNITQIALHNYASANGTWSLRFSDDTHGSIVAPNGTTVTNFTLPDFAGDPNYAANFSPSTSMVQFGADKNDGNSTGVNDNQSFLFTHVLVTNAASGTAYDDSFGGPGLTANYAWQVAEYYQDAANRVLWQPYGTAWWLQWGLPATGYTVQSAANLTGPWSDAGVTFTYTDASGTNIFGALPSASLPAGHTAFFELINTNTP